MNRYKLLLAAAATASLAIGLVAIQPGGGQQFGPQCGGPNQPPCPATAYTAKFSCGEFGKPLPATRPDVPEGPYAPGYYQTAINVHNPNFQSVALSKKAVLIYAATEQNAPVAEQQPFEVPQDAHRLNPVNLNADQGFLIDCQDIRAVLLQGNPPPPVPAAPRFIEGDIVVYVWPTVSVGGACTGSPCPPPPQPCGGPSPQPPCAPQCGPGPPGPSGPSAAPTGPSGPSGPPPTCSTGQPQTLDVTAVYTSHGYNCTDNSASACPKQEREGFSQEVVTVTPQQAAPGPPPPPTG